MVIIIVDKLAVAGVGEGGVLSYAYAPDGRAPMPFASAATATAWWAENAPTLPDIGESYIRTEDVEPILLRSSGGVLAQEIPHPAEDGRGWITGAVIAQEIREVSAAVANGLVSVVQDGGRWRLALDGESGIEAYAS